MEHILILIVEIGSVCGVFYALFQFLFKASFSDVIEPLKNAVNGLSNNVASQTKMLNQSLDKIEALQKEVNDHNTRLKVLEYREEHDEHNN